MIKKLQKKYALSEQGAKDLIKGCLACVLQNLSFMFPVGLLYYLVSDLMNGGVPGGKIPFYVAGCARFSTEAPMSKGVRENLVFRSLVPSISTTRSIGLWLSRQGSR